MNDKWFAIAFLLILLIGFSIRLIGSQLFIPGAGPDEPLHFYWIKCLHEGKECKYTIATTKAFGQTFLLSTHHFKMLTFIQSKFFPLIEEKDTKTKYFFFRLFNVFLATMLVLIVYLIARQLLSRELSLLAMAFVSFLPTFNAISATINNYFLAWIFCALMIYFALKYIDSKSKTSLFLTGFFFFIAIFARADAISLLLLWLFLLYLKIKQDRKIGFNVLPFLFPFIALFSIIFFITGQFTGLDATCFLFSYNFEWFTYLVTHFLTGFFLQEYATAGMPPRELFYIALGMLSLIAVYGVIKKFNQAFDCKIVALMLCCLGSIGIFFAINLFTFAPDARYTYMSLPAFAVLFVQGLNAFDKTNKLLFGLLFILLFFSTSLVFFPYTTELTNYYWLIIEEAF